MAQNFSGPQWGFLFVFACLSMVLPYMLYLSGLKYLDPTRAVITSCLEPVFAILFAVLFVGETLRTHADRRNRGRAGCHRYGPIEAANDCSAYIGGLEYKPLWL